MALCFLAGYAMHAGLCWARNQAAILMAMAGIVLQLLFCVWLVSLARDFH